MVFMCFLFEERGLRRFVEAMKGLKGNESSENMQEPRKCALDTSERKTGGGESTKGSSSPPEHSSPRCKLSKINIHQRSFPVQEQDFPLESKHL
jgi:hypothetical protein